MSQHTPFTVDQIQYLSEQAQQVLGNDFNFKLSKSKHRAFMAKLLKAPNLDAALQRAKSASKPSEQPLEECYRWMKSVIIDGEQRYLRIGDPRYDELDLSEFQFDTLKEAQHAVDEEIWGFSVESLPVGSMIVREAKYAVQETTNTPITDQDVRKLMSQQGELVNVAELRHAADECLQEWAYAEAVNWDSAEKLVEGLKAFPASRVLPSLREILAHSERDDSDWDSQVVAEWPAIIQQACKEIDCIEPESIIKDGQHHGLVRCNDQREILEVLWYPRS